MKIDHSKFFRKDQYGNNVYYPYALGKGYIIPNDDKYNQIIQLLQKLEKVIFAYFVICPFLGWAAGVMKIDIVLAFFLGIIGGYGLIYAYYKIIIYPNIKDLPISPDRMKLKDFLIRQVCSMSVKFYIGSVALFLILFLLTLTTGISKIMNIICAISMLAYMAGLIIKLKYRKFEV